MAKKKSDSKNASVHKDLEGFDIKINEFGELTTSYHISKLNEFLNENLKDKKFKEEE